MSKRKLAPKSLTISCMYFITILCLTSSLQVFAQQQKKGSIIGIVSDSSHTTIPGATISVEGGKIAGTLTDQNGRFAFSYIPYGKYTLHISYMGYKEVIYEVDLEREKNDVNINLGKETASALSEVVVTTQKRTERLLSVPIAITSLSAKTLTNYGITDLTRLSSFTPGLNIAIQSIQHPIFTIRGINSDDFGAFARSRLSVYHNGVPVSRGGGAGIALFDMSVDAIKGPQGTVFGQGSLVGGISYRSNMPKNQDELEANVGFGNYNQSNMSLMINTPIIKDKLLIRLGGDFDNRDGFVKNTYGGTLNGQNTLAGKVYLTYYPSTNTQVNIMYDYEHNNSPGTAFFTGLPNTQGNTDMYSKVISMVPGRDLNVNRTLHEITGTVNSHLSNNLSLTTITSFRPHKDYEFWQSDGAASNALGFKESDDIKQFYQEARLNYSSKKVKAFIGASYFKERVNDQRSYSPNEQTLFWLYVQQPNKLVNSDGSPNPQATIPNVDKVPAGLVGKPLTTNREEDMFTSVNNSSLDVFSDITYSLTNKLSVTGGLRLTNDKLESSYMGTNNGVPVNAGFILNPLQNYLIFKPTGNLSQNGNFTNVTGRAVLQYKFTENQNVYSSFSTGRRPPVLQYDNNGVFSKLSAENVTSYELGYKHQPIPSLSYDVAVFYYDYNNFFTKSQKFGEPFSGVNGGKATTYGTELSIRYKLNNNINFSGNYAYNHARFDKKDSEGKVQQLAGQQFRLSPDHTLNLLVELCAIINKNAMAFLTPSFSYKSTQPLFDNASENQPWLYQKGYGIANVISGIRFNKPQITASVYCNNAFDRKYMLNGANTGRAYGLPGYVPGFPVMYGMRLAYTL